MLRAKMQEIRRMLAARAKETGPTSTVFQWVDGDDIDTQRGGDVIVLEWDDADSTRYDNAGDDE